MPLPVTDTCSGTDSDGKIWGIEGSNVLIILFGLLMSLGFTVLIWTILEKLLLLPCLFSLVPVISAFSYVFCLRQGKPKAFDTDLMETLVVGKGWMPNLCHRTSDIKNPKKYKKESEVIK